jgi:hypothetical protein
MGTYVVHKRRKDRWYLAEVTYKDGGESRKTVPIESFVSLGFSKGMSVDQAKERAKQVNKQKRLEDKKARAASQRVADQKYAESAYLPEHLQEKFKQKLEEDYFGSDAYLDKIWFHWDVVRDLIVELKIEPKDYLDNKARIYKHLQGHQYSLSYINKTLTILNQFGRMVCRLQGQYFEPVPSPEGRAKQAVLDSYKKSKTHRKKTDPITPEQLEEVKDRFAHLPGQWEWLKVSVEFGLRPMEVDALAHDKDSFEIKKQDGRIILRVYQSKLMAINEEDRWKSIPVVYPGQEEALELIKKGNLRKPLAKTIKSIFTEKTRPYSGRKGFVDMMLARGERLEDVTQWLGHQSINRTWKDYKDKQRVHSTMPKKTG